MSALLYSFDRLKRVGRNEKNYGCQRGNERGKSTVQDQRERIERPGPRVIVVRIRELRTLMIPAGTVNRIKMRMDRPVMVGMVVRSGMNMLKRRS